MGRFGKCAPDQMFGSFLFSIIENNFSRGDSYIRVSYFQESMTGDRQVMVSFNVPF